ncbi:MAG TPA: hypothetical protein DD435_15840 [Cyanobacteria bacterium UBA8530]|nr:hypothetical protein [Cyanobacteria bacterium UBA8530]
MRVLVTGATGFLGYHLVRRLMEKEFRPIVTRRSTSDPRRLRDLESLECIELELRSPESIRKALQAARPDAVIHCAAYGVDHRQQDPLEAIAINLTATTSLVEAAASVRVARFIHVGTCFEYGDHPGPISETTPLQPRSLYGATKAAGTLLALERAGHHGLPLCVVRPFGMYGAREGEHKLVPLIRRACETGEVLPLTLGEQVRDYSFVGDVTEAIFRLLNAESFPSAEIFNLAGGVPITLKDFILACASVFGGEALMGFGMLPYRKNEMASLVANCGKWERFCGHPVFRTALAEGLALMKRPMEDR